MILLKHKKLKYAHKRKGPKNEAGDSDRRKLEKRLIMLVKNYLNVIFHLRHISAMCLKNLGRSAIRLCSY